MREQCSPWGWRLFEVENLIWCCCRRKEGGISEVWGRNKNRKHGFVIRLFPWLIYTPIQYQCQLLLRILTGLNWFACEIVLVIFKLNSCLSDQTLYQYLVQAVQMMYLDCCHCSSTDSKHNHFKVPWECVECNYNSFMILMMFF